jgi:hypothetical protein
MFLRTEKVLHLRVLSFIVESHEQDWNGRPDTRGEKLLAAPLAGIASGVND